MDGQAELPEKYWELVERYRGELMNQALALLGNLEDAEDVVQETFCEAFRHRERLAQVQSLGNWLRAINRANATDRVRANAGESDKVDRKHRQAPERSVTTGGFSLMDLRESVARAIERLPDELRAVIVLSYWEHLTYEQIAERLKVSPITVRRRLYQASTQLYARLKIHFGVGPASLPAGTEAGPTPQPEEKI